jgi:hypothetical protein
MTFETLGRRLKVVAAFLAFTAVGSAGRRAVRVRRA